MADEKLNEEFDEEDDSIIVLKNDEGEDVEFYHIATLDYKDEWYIFLQPVVLEENMDDDEMYIFKLGVDDNGDDLFIPIDDEETLNAVYDEFLKEAECGCGDDGCDDCGCGCDHHHD